MARQDHVGLDLKLSAPMHTEGPRFQEDNSMGILYAWIHVRTQACLGAKGLRLAELALVQKDTGNIELY